MMRRIAVLVCLVPTVAAGETRLHLGVPDLTLLEPMYHLDRGTAWERRTSSGLLVNAGAGYGSHDGKSGLVGEGTLTAGYRLRRLAIAASSQLVAGGNALARGHHRGLFELKTHDRQSDDFSGKLMLGLDIEHGEARGLAPVHLGAGNRDHARANAAALIHLLPDKDDVQLAALVYGEGSATLWHDAPIDRAIRRGGGMAIVMSADEDDELPRGRMELLRVHVEHGSIARTLSAASAELGDATVRSVDVIAGFKDFTFWIDHELLMVFTTQVGGTWIETERTPEDELTLKLDLGMHMKWRQGWNGRRELGFVIARQPTTTPDGQNIVSDWRLELVAAAEDRRFVFDVRGGISWVTNIAGDESVDTIKRYGSHLQGFVKLGLGVEAGAYHAMTFEPQLAGDPWATPRTWATEAGLLARYRTASF